MTETPLEYDRIIWTVFSVGVISSVVMLYYVRYMNISDSIGKILAFSLGFSVLVYSFMLIRGYAWKKRCLLEVHPDKALKEKIDHEPYFRVRWIGEIILGFIGSYYIISFSLVEHYYIIIPIIIILFFALLSCLANIYK